MVIGELHANLSNCLDLRYRHVRTLTSDQLLQLYAAGSFCSHLDEHDSHATCDVSNTVEGFPRV